jgi:hypothetical protein
MTTAAVSRRAQSGFALVPRRVLGSRSGRRPPIETTFPLRNPGIRSAARADLGGPGGRVGIQLQGGHDAHPAIDIHRGDEH